MIQVDTLHPPGLPIPVGYAHMARAVGEAGTLLLLGGVTGMDETGQITHPHELPAQMERALANIKAAIAYAGGQVEHVVRMRIYTTDMAAYRAQLKELGAVWRRQFGRHYPAMALLGVSELFDPQAMVEIECEAILPTSGR